MTDCTHLDAVEVTALPASIDGCAECLEAGGQWCHLRICLTCAHVGCCDSSPGKHATAHSRSAGHPIMRSVQPGDNWAWCFEDELAMVIPDVTGQPSIPPSPLCP